MDEKEIYETLSSFKGAIDLILQRLDEMDKMYHGADERMDKLENTLYDEILSPAKAAMDEEEKEGRYKNFHDKYGSMLDPFNAGAQAIEGGDFDLSRKAFDDYDSIEGDKPDEGEYVKAFTENIGKQLEDIKNKLGIQGPVAATLDNTGETTITNNGKKVEAVPAAATAATGHEEPDADNMGGQTDNDGDMPQDDPAEIKKYEDELEKEMKSTKRS
jgi:hypothetical protein